MSKECDGPTWLLFLIRHVEHDPEYYIDGYEIWIDMEVREAGDEQGATSEWWPYSVLSNGYGITCHCESRGWDEYNPQTITWRNLRRVLKREILLDCLYDLKHLKPVRIDFGDDRGGNWYDINPNDYSIDINQYLYKEVQHG